MTCDYKRNSDLGYLPSTNGDHEEMLKTFQTFEYDIHPLKNKDATEESIKNLLVQLHFYFQTTKVTRFDNDQRKKAIVFVFSGHGDSDQQDTDYIVGNDGGKVLLINDIMRAFVTHTGNIALIPKLFFIDACRGHHWLTMPLPRGDRVSEINCRIDYSGHNSEDKDKWIRLVAAGLREKDLSVGDIMTDVRRQMYEQGHTIPQIPDTRDHLVVGPLRLWYSPKAQLP